MWVVWLVKGSLVEMVAVMIFVSSCFNLHLIVIGMVVRFSVLI